MLRNSCEFFGFIETPVEESILIFHSCSSNLNVNKDNNICDENHIGNVPRSIMTKGTSTRRKNGLPGYLYGNFDPGDQDKLMITYRRDKTHNYDMNGACGVVYHGDMHFFGGREFKRQHFKIEMQRSGKLVKMTKMKDLEIELYDPLCSSFGTSSENIVILCFPYDERKSCFSFDGKLTHIGNSNYDHHYGGLKKYKRYLLTIGGGSGTQKTELMERSRNETFVWSENKTDFKFSRGYGIWLHSLVTIPPSHLNEEYVLLIGGYSGGYSGLKNVFKFNGTWFPFGQLNRPRAYHNCIYWNGAVYVIGGSHSSSDHTKMEIWKIKDSPDRFKTSENWPELYNWLRPHLFIVPDSFFPDF